MKWLKKAEDSTSVFLLDHPKVRQWSTWTGKFIVEAISAFIFAYGFRAFISPTLTCVQQWIGEEATSVEALISGGASGIAQTIIKFVEMFPGVSLVQYETTIISILYFCINIPILILAWLKISKQFTIFTLINVAFVSIFNQVIPDSIIYDVVNIYEDHLARAIFAGITTGVSSSIAFMVGTSTGGVDVIALYISEKKSTGVGKYSTITNCCVVSCYVIFSLIGAATNPDGSSTDSTTSIVTMVLYTFAYFFVSGHVIDLLNIKNKKQELQIISNDENLPTVLIRAFPHACSIIDSEGAYSRKKNKLLIMVLSKSEIKEAVKIIKDVDPLAFITVIDLNQVYGRFYIKPIE